MNSLSLLVGGSPPSLTLLASSTMSSLDPSVGKHLLYSSPCGCKYVHNINVIIETQKNIMFTFFNWIGGGHEIAASQSLIYSLYSSYEYF